MARYRPAHRAKRKPQARLAWSAKQPGPSRRPISPVPTGHDRRSAGGDRRGRLATALAVVALLAGGGAANPQSRPQPVAGAPAPGNATEQEQSVTTTGGVVSAPVGAAGQTSVRITSENAKPGSRAWHLDDAGASGLIEGYADRTSALPGQAVTLYVSTTADTFHVEAYRMGYYHGLGGRQVWTSPQVGGASQAMPSFTRGLNMVEAQWQPSLLVSTSGWPEGDYLFKLVASTGKEQYVPLTLRNDTSSAAYVVINAVTTWQAYNRWGGFDLYDGDNGKVLDAAHRSRVVSFDRPYALGDGAGDFLGLEFPLVSLVESLGLDVTYVTDVDLHEHPRSLLDHRAVFSLGHDEYYSMTMRRALETARDRGVNLAFLGANAVYRHIRFGPSPLGEDRHEINYRLAAEDPLTGKDDADVTVDWRDPPNNNPESRLIGNYYRCNPVRADMVVVDPSNWLFAHTGAVAGQRLPDAIGSEYDRYDPSVPGPANVEILAHSPLTCRGRADHADVTYYSAASGAGVFASGTINFVGHLDTRCQPADCAGRVLGRVTENLLSTFGAGPAGAVHPSDPNASDVASRMVGPGTAAPNEPGTGAGPVAPPETANGTNVKGR